MDTSITGLRGAEQSSNGGVRPAAETMEMRRHRGGEALGWEHRKTQTKLGRSLQRSESGEKRCAREIVEDLHARGAAFTALTGPGGATRNRRCRSGPGCSSRGDPCSQVACCMTEEGHSQASSARHHASPAAGLLALCLSLSPELEPQYRPGLPAGRRAKGRAGCLASRPSLAQSRRLRFVPSDGDGFAPATLPTAAPWPPRALQVPPVRHPRWDICPARGVAPCEAKARVVARGTEYRVLCDHATGAVPRPLLTCCDPRPCGHEPSASLVYRACLLAPA